MADAAANKNVIRTPTQGSFESCISDHRAREIKQDKVSGPAPADPAADVCSRGARTVIFFAFCQGVQCWMSYDGGATPASLDAIQEEMDNSWSNTEFGILGAIDKVGITVSSMFWGRALQKCNAKALLCACLLVNGLCTLAFGSLRNKLLMYSAKFLMGATQALQGVWGTVWTVAMAPPDRKTIWLGLGGVSAGIGNGIGTLVAGIGTGNGAPYAFAFQLQAGVLLALWVALCFAPARCLDFNVRRYMGRSPTDESGDSGEYAPPTRADSKPLGIRMQLRALWRNRTFVWTTLQISLIMFQVSGIQYLWVRFYVRCWNLNQTFVTTMYLVVAGGGGGIGIAYGPAYIDSLGGYSTPLGVLTSIRALQKFGQYAAFSGVLGLVFIAAKDGNRVHMFNHFGDQWLWLSWLALAVLHAAHQACVPALCGINMECVVENMRTFASGTEMTVRNILGYACGPLLPSLLMEAVQAISGWDVRTSELLDARVFIIGMASILVLNLLCITNLTRAERAAERSLHEQRMSATKQLQDALAAEDLIAIEKAIAAGHFVSLRAMEGGEAIMGMADEFRAEARIVTNGSSNNAVAGGGEGYEMVALEERKVADGKKGGIDELASEVREIQQLREENRQFREENRVLRARLASFEARAAARSPSWICLPRFAAAGAEAGVAGTALAAIRLPHTALTPAMAFSALASAVPGATLLAKASSNLGPSNLPTASM